MLWYFLRGLELETSWNQVWPAFPPSSHTMWWSSPPRSWCHLPWFFPDAGDVKFPISMLVLLVQFPKKCQKQWKIQVFFFKTVGTFPTQVCFLPMIEVLWILSDDPDPSWLQSDGRSGFDWRTSWIHGLFCKFSTKTRESTWIVLFHLMRKRLVWKALP